MRHSLTLLALLVSSSILAQTTRIVDNNFNAPTGANVYTTLQAAADAAVAGDIIYVQPSPTKYGSITIEKPNITLMGIGFDLTKDLAYGSVITNISLINDAANVDNGSGARITGLTIDNIYPGAVRTGTGGYTLTNVLIENNSIGTVYQPSSAYAPTESLEIRDNRIRSYCYFYKPQTNLLLRNNLFQGSSVYILFTEGPNIAEIRNNIIYGYITADNDQDNIIIENNNFMGSNSSSAYSFSKLRADLVTNNIFYGRSPRGTTNPFYDNIFTFNLVYGTFDDTMPPVSVGGSQNTGLPNTVGTDPNFINVPISDTWSSAYDFTPQSAAVLGQGSDGISDIGITGGSFPWGETNFKLDTTPIPTIESFNTSTSINPGQDLQITIKAKGN